ncbi:hypothetical protein T01_3858 [Trichinella spiralis]|uniref:Uncharacterized protein n=1 Tax=Trichinella spiralis TaxID=6334 RepID=A0A0V0YXP6_TRISP|nr:hypothetical protein T01_3858 [Trichinella spiralis]
MPFVILSCCACLRSTGRLMIFCQASHSRASSTKRASLSSTYFWKNLACFILHKFLGPMFQWQSL